MESLPDDMLRALQRMGLLDVVHSEAPLMGERLTGGVSSDIWRVDLQTGAICVKRALAKLRVDADWQAPVKRNLFEARWMQVASRIVPNAVPALLGHDIEGGMLAMSYLPPGRFVLWKTLLRNGIANPDFAAAVAATIGRIHASTAADPSTPSAFSTDAIFLDIRLEPYLLATSRSHPDLAEQFKQLVATTMANKRTLVHGDVSPKNILSGPHGPVLLDAECAWWGDPAFDLAFCLNHLLLKCIWVPSARPGFLACFDAMARRYLQEVTWESAAALEARTAHLLPALLLARVDGKSPIEYITDEAGRAKVRRVARSLLMAPRDHLEDIAVTWRQAMISDQDVVLDPDRAGERRTE